MRGEYSLWYRVEGLRYFRVIVMVVYWLIVGKIEVVYFLF